MRLREYLDKDLILPELVSTGKQDVLGELVAPLSQKLTGFDAGLAASVLMERESLGTTGIGEGVAIPHGKLAGLEEIELIVGRSKAGVEYDALDFLPCTIFFLVLAPERTAGTHLRILAQISRLLKDLEFRRQFMDADGRDGLWRLLSGT